MVYHARGERNFHIFYQLLQGAEQDLIKLTELIKDEDSYYYLNRVSLTSSVYPVKQSVVNNEKNLSTSPPFWHLEAL